MRIVLHGTITAVEPETHHAWVSGTGVDAIFEDRVRHWYIVINKAFRVFAGIEQPDFEVGNIVTITITKEKDLSNDSPRDNATTPLSDPTSNPQVDVVPEPIKPR